MDHRITRSSQKANFAFKSPVPHSMYSRTSHSGPRFSWQISSFFKNPWKLLLLIALFLSSFSLAYALQDLDSNGMPKPAALGLPFEWSSDATTPIVKIIKETIKYVGLLAILAISWGGIQFLTSIWNEEKVKHAKQTIIYSLVGVILSVVAYTIIDIVNSLRI